MIFLLFYRVVQPAPKCFQNILITLKIASCLLESLIFLTDTPGSPLKYFVPLWIYLFWTFHINEVMQYVFFCIWYLSWNIVLLRYISVAACFGLAKKSFFFFFFFCKIKDTFFIFSNNFLDLDFYLFMYLFIFNFYCYSITVICLFSQSLHPTPAEPTSLPHLHPPP